ncbi:Hypothetical protein CAP_2921 [Chondromyces apiculatus DSM 436]|uniref:Uncharacterized protein n=1 Tax=Chondromyces apiculatus DSM 436 TaxID=1192034 RepID=A0A017TAK8_9BACT|nr:Hypothetical protein CAP_2921 [Chondromyces apiculatus DSM 436]
MHGRIDEAPGNAWRRRLCAIVSARARSASLPGKSLVEADTEGLRAGPGCALRKVRVVRVGPKFLRVDAKFRACSRTKLVST